MTSFKDARNLVLESYNDGIIDDEEFILLYEGNVSKNPEFPYEDYERFDSNAMDETECKAEFRFTKSEIPRLAEALDIPGVKTTDLPLSLLRFDPSFRATSTGAEHDLQQRFGLHLQHTRPQNKPVEPHNSRCCWSREVCWSSLWQRCSTGQLHRIHRWDRKTNLSSWWITKSRIQWSQAGTRTKISII